MRIKKEQPNRFKHKGQYSTVDKSLLHQWLKEEGYNRQGLSADLDVTPMTIDRYMDHPEKMKLHTLKQICMETGVDANFVMSLIYDNSK